MSHLIWVLLILALAGIAFGCFVWLRSSKRIREVSEELNQWRRMAEISHQDLPLTDTANRALELISQILPAQVWALYGYERARNNFKLLGIFTHSGSKSVLPGHPLAEDDVESRAEAPLTLPMSPHTRQLEVHTERGLPVLNIPLGSVDPPSALIQAFPVGRTVLNTEIRAAVVSLQKPLAEMIANSRQRELQKTLLSHARARGDLGEVLLGSTFNLDHFINNILGTVVTATSSSGALLYLKELPDQLVDFLSPAPGAVVFQIGAAKGLPSRNPAAWLKLQDKLIAVREINAEVGTGLLSPDAMPAQFVMRPIDANGRESGMLILVRQGPTAYRAEEIQLLQQFNQQIGSIWEQRRLYGAAKDVYRATLQMIVELMDGKKPETAEHSSRVMFWSSLTGVAMGLGKDDLETIQWAALLHDVGMCTLGEEASNEQNTTGHVDLDMIRQHPLRGAILCAPLHLPNPIAPGVRAHHERWDGHGYPDGLVGEEIPLHGRIIAVAEVFNALTSAREYRPPQSVENALKKIQEERGNAFDPNVVDAFVRASSGAQAPESAAQ